MQDDTDKVKVLNLLPKPLGFDLRDRRSTKSNKAAEWTVHDALYDAQQAMIKLDHCNAVLIIFSEAAASDDTTTTHFRMAGPVGSGQQLLLNGLGKFMGWAK